MARDTLSFTQDQDGRWSLDGDTFPYRFQLSTGAFAFAKAELPEDVMTFPAPGDVAFWIGDRHATYRMTEDSLGLVFTRIPSEFDLLP